MTDFHSHFFPSNLADKAVRSIESISDGLLSAVASATRESLIDHLNFAGVKRAVTLPVATRAEQVRSINSSLISDSPLLIPFGSLFPSSADCEKELQLLVESSIKGIKLHPPYQGFNCDDMRFRSLFKKIEEIGIIVVLHAGDDPAFPNNDMASPARIARLIERHPDLKLVASHMGGLERWDEVLDCLVGTPLYLDTSAVFNSLPSDLFCHICREHGVEKVLMGSDFPWFSPLQALSYIERSGLTQDEQLQITAINAEKLLWGCYVG